MGRIIIEYCPNISQEAEEIISSNITPSMTSLDGDHSQYCLDMISTDLLGELSKKDAEIINSLIEDGVDYIEF